MAQKLRKELQLLDVFVISTGAMISSGFFLLPGIAAAEAGAGVVIAYIIAGILIIPAMLSMAELATAMPKAGGTYYYLDRTLGPLVGTIGGFSTWLTLVLKSGFALIGMGVYVAIVIDVPVFRTSIALAIVFCVLNILGSRRTSGLIRIFVVTLLTILGVFILSAMVEVAGRPGGFMPGDDFSPLLRNGVDGLLGTVGLVFVSYIGLTNVASLAEEVHRPERNIPLGMTLALATVTVIYVVGVYLMVAILGVDELSQSLTPVADTAMAFERSIPATVAKWLVVLSAIVAFASMANAGILAASRYPLAMGRDGLLPKQLATISRFGTPIPAILVTGGTLVLFLLALNVAQVAKVASALQLLLFGLINVSVIVMRESRIESYDPEFRSPGYPWVQFIGLFVALVLVGEMGWLPVLFTVGVTAVGFGWYNYYARDHIKRDGAIFHVFERLGRRRFAGLDRELRDIMKEKGARAEDPFDEVVARAYVLDLAGPVDLDQIVRRGCERLAERLPVEASELEADFHRSIAVGAPVAHGSALLHVRLSALDESEIALVRAKDGLRIDDADVTAIFMLVSGEKDPGRHLRILAQLAGRVEDDNFTTEWLASVDEQEMKEVLLRNDRFLSLVVQAGTKTESLNGRALRDLRMPEGSLIALIWRRGQSIVPRGATELQEGDRLTIIGEPLGLQALAEEYGATWP
jgi:amino acid transporter/mannitol/fructose-specific phosphotransferase system IIA component (Ntr-type)